MKFTINPKTEAERRVFQGGISVQTIDLTVDKTRAAVIDASPGFDAALRALAVKLAAQFNMDEITFQAIGFTGVRFIGEPDPEEEPDPATKAARTFRQAVYALPRCPRVCADCQQDDGSRLHHWYWKANEDDGEALERPVLTCKHCDAVLVPDTDFHLDFGDEDLPSY